MVDRGRALVSGKVVVTGASGLLGGNLAIALGEAGYDVVATKRGSSRVEHLDGVPITWVDADLGDADALARAFDGARTVFHCAALVSIRRAITTALLEANVTGTKNVLAAVRRAGVGRLVHCSTVGAVGLSPDGAPCTEDSAWSFPDQGMLDGYVTTKRWSEDLVHVAVMMGLDAVIACPTYMFGPYDAKPSSGKMIVEVVRRKVPGWTPGKNNFVDVRDVARGMIAVAERGRTGERYILGGENMTYREVMERIAKVAGVAPPRLPAPRPVAAVLGMIGDLAERASGQEPLVNSTAVGYGFTDRFVFSSDKARAELGYAPGPIEPAVEAAIAWFRGRGML